MHRLFSSIDGNFITTITTFSGEHMSKSEKLQIQLQKDFISFAREKLKEMTYILGKKRTLFVTLENILYKLCFVYDLVYTDEIGNCVHEEGNSTDKYILSTIKSLLKQQQQVKFETKFVATFECAVLEFGTMMQDIRIKHAQLRNPFELQNVTVLGKNFIQQYFETINGNIQYRFMCGVKNPYSFLAKDADLPDNCGLYLKIKENSASTNSGTVANEWFDYFAPGALPWRSREKLFENEEKKGKRRKKAHGDGKEQQKEEEEQDGGPSVLLKCRFASALYDIEKAGILKCSKQNESKIATKANDSVVVTKKLYTWLN